MHSHLTLRVTAHSQYIINCVQVATTVFKHNFYPMLYTLGAMCMAMHSEAVREYDGCPVTVIVGKSGRGKTSALKLGLAMTGNTL